MSGNAGRKLLDGGAGADQLIGGAGDDIYVIDNAGDAVVENANEGSDTVRAAISYTLGANVENLVLTGVPDINATGNALANVLDGNAGNNMLDGGAGADTMAAVSATTLTWSTTQAMRSSEKAMEGDDTIRSSISFVLSANVENLILTGTGNLNGTGKTAGQHPHWQRRQQHPRRRRRRRHA